MNRRLISTCRRLQHDNPLNLPRSRATPQIPRMQRGLPQQRLIPNVKKVIAVSSAKGGVGKSTIAVNLALSFARRGYRAGILDADIFGPSIPTLLGLTGEPRLTSNNHLIPLSNYGVQSMSMGYLVPDSSPVVWRGLMVTKALQQLLHEVEWGTLDILVIDLPPGTGDVQLTVAQQVKLDGAVIVSTPQEVSLKDAIKGVHMFRKVNVPVLGMVTNMASFSCPDCHTIHPLFGTLERIRDKCVKDDVRLLRDIPLHQSICDDADRGKPTVVAEPNSERSKIFDDIANSIQEYVDLR